MHIFPRQIVLFHIYGKGHYLVLLYAIYYISVIILVYLLAAFMTGPRDTAKGEDSSVMGFEGSHVINVGVASLSIPYPLAWYILCRRHRTSSLSEEGMARQWTS